MATSHDPRACSPKHASMATIVLEEELAHQVRRCHVLTGWHRVVGKHHDANVMKRAPQTILPLVKGTLWAADQSVQTLGLLCDQSFFRVWRREAQATFSIPPEVPPKRQEVA